MQLYLIHHVKNCFIKKSEHINPKIVLLKCCRFLKFQVETFNGTKVRWIPMNTKAIQIHNFSPFICWMKLLLIQLKPGQTRSLWLRLVYRLFIIEHNSNIHFIHSSETVTVSCKVKTLLNPERNSQCIQLPLPKSYIGQCDEVGTFKLRFRPFLLYSGPFLP